MGAEPRFVRSVLLVDDVPGVLNMWERDLKRVGKLAAKATNREDAVRLAAETRPELAVVDFILRGQNGADVLHDLKHLDPNVFVVIVSMQMSTALAMACMKAGADYCCTKPVTCRELLSVVECGGAQLSDFEPATLTADQFEWEFISRALLDCDNNITRTADRLGMYRNTLRRKLEKRGLSTTDARKLTPRRPNGA